jgi:hypothetical protein
MRACAPERSEDVANGAKESVLVLLFENRKRIDDFLLSMRHQKT